MEGPFEVAAVRGRTNIGICFVKGILTRPSGFLQTFFELEEAVMRGVTAVFIVTAGLVLQVMFAQCPKPVFNRVSLVWREFTGGF